MTDDAASIQFQTQWKEGLHSTMDGHSCAVEFTMGIPTVYFPTRSRWEARALDWARGQWERVHNRAWVSF